MAHLTSCTFVPHSRLNYTCSVSALTRTNIDTEGLHQVPAPSPTQTLDVLTTLALSNIVSIRQRVLRAICLAPHKHANSQRPAAASHTAHRCPHPGRRPSRSRPPSRSHPPDVIVAFAICVYNTVMVTLNATAESLSIAGILLETSFAQLLNWTWPDIYIASTMKTFCIAFLSLFSTATVLRAQNIVLTNDDGWAVAQIRAQFNALATESDFNVRRVERSTTTGG